MEKKQYLVHQLWIKMDGLEINANSIVVTVLAENTDEAEKLFRLYRDQHYETDKYTSCGDVNCMLLSDIPLIGAQ